jgi:hypothetical protein
MPPDNARKDIMHMTGLAHEVQEAKRVKLVADLETLIERAEGVFGGKEYFYKVLIMLIAKEVSHVHRETDTDHFEGIPDIITKQISDFFWQDIRTPIRAFQRSEADGALIYIRLLENAAPVMEEINRSTVKRQEKENPQQMLHTGNYMDQVQYE